MSDTIVYTCVSIGGGMDGMDHTDKGGDVCEAYLDRKKAEANKNAPWRKIVPTVVDLEAVAKSAMFKLDPVARLAVETHYKIKI